MPFEKVDESGNFRPGPAEISEVLPLVVKYIPPGCTISSDGLLAYKKTLRSMGYRHTSVNHSAGEFVDATNPENHTQNIENRWSDLKNTLRGMRGMKKEHQPKLLWERMWRHNLKVERKNAFDEILSLLGRMMVVGLDVEEGVEEGVEEDVLDAE